MNEKRTLATIITSVGSGLLVIALFVFSFDHQRSILSQIAFSLPFLYIIYRGQKLAKDSLPNKESSKTLRHTNRIIVSIIIILAIVLLLPFFFSLAGIDIYSI